MHLKRLFTSCAVLATVTIAACDDDPASPSVSFNFAGCPAGDLAVNASIPLNFTQPVRPSTISPANVIVTNAQTGLEIPGSLALGANDTRVSFSPSSPLPFGTILAIRVQNILSANGTTPLGVIVCNVRTQAPPIAEVVWDRLESPTGTNLAGASLFSADSGWVASLAVPLYKRIGEGWDVRFNQPYFVRSYDVDFVSARHGFGAHLDQRQARGVITESLDGGLTFDTVFTRPFRDIQRLFVDSTRSARLFGVAGGGTASSAMFVKMTPGSPSTWAVTNEFVRTSSVVDIDFASNDTTVGYAVTNGVFFNSRPPIIYPGRLYRTANGGGSWTEVANAQADTVNVIAYRGVAHRRNGDVFVTGGNGFVGRFAGGAAPATKINLGIVSRDSTSFTALIYNDVQFAPDNDLIGWIVGAELTGIENGIPRFRGLIFRTVDGGATWVRQGVRGAEEYGALFPALNRLEVFSSTKAWAVGEGGTVISLRQ